MQTTKKKRIVGLDVLRILLAFLIFLFHSRVHLGCSYGLLNNFIESGSLAMSAFFMLSGYCLQFTHDKKIATNFTLKEFYLKRLIAIYPLYFFTGTLFVTMCIAAGKQTIFDNLLLLPIEILGLQAIFTNSLFPYAHNSGTWFISCLLICYISFPLLQSLLSIPSKLGGGKLLFMSAAFLILAPIIVVHFNLTSIYTNPFYRLVEFNAGIILAQINLHNNQATRSKWMYNWGNFWIVSIVLVVGVSLFRRWGISNNAIIVEPSFFIIILLMGTLSFPKIFHTKLLSYLSKISYAFFLGQFFIWHPTKFLLQLIPSIPNILIILGTLIGCIIIAVILYEFVEKKSSNFFTKLILSKWKPSDPKSLFL